MNLLNGNWIKYGTIECSYSNKKMVIQNRTDSHKFLVYPKLFKANSEKGVTISLSGKVLSGTGCTLKILNKNKTILGECGLNSVFRKQYDWLKYYIVVLYVPAESKIEITEVKLENSASLSKLYSRFDDCETLVITPGYPSLENKYNTAFVHTRAQAYQKLGWKFKVLCINENNSTLSYKFEGIEVIKGDFYFLRCLLQKKQFNRILIHFFDDRYANVLESVDLSNSQLYFFLHGAETLYRDWGVIAARYFDEITGWEKELDARFKIKDFYIKKYNQFKNAKWVFVTDWTKKRCEDLLGIQFNNSEIVPCLIDTELFKYEKKDPDLRKKIFVLRKFEDISSYSLDTVVRIILELSHREFFDDLEFSIYGDGSMHDRILSPLRQFKNVHIYKHFLSHDEIREVHRTHGIALFPTRYDSQAVSSCEAASSGCAVITSDIPGVRQFIPEDLGVLCHTEEYKEYADVIEKMYYDPEYFLEVGRRESESVCSKFDYEHTILKEIKMYENEDKRPYFGFKEISDDPVLTVVIPSYNVATFLRGTVVSLIDQPNAEKIEILIVNDGSKDDTVKIAKEFEKLTTVGGKSIVRVIDKENGGHGSTINVGIAEARGKYLKIVDGDDTVDSEEFSKLIDLLEKEDSDIVLNNYLEDFAKDNYLNKKKIYTLLKPGVQYHFDDLCYPDYGFTTWGPILSCSSYKTSVLREAGFKLSEHTFYVDMELNINVAAVCDTITYYDLDIYRYLLGQNNQSVTVESYTRNYKHHERVCFNMIKTYYQYASKVSKSKRWYMKEHLIIPMLKAQYDICIYYKKEKDVFEEFDKRLKRFPEFYNHDTLSNGEIKFYRSTEGKLIGTYDTVSKFRGLLVR